MSERLQKILARAGYGSRRSCESLIKAGRVSVNGQSARLGMKADSRIDRIEVDGQPIEIQDFIYIKLNKPKGVLSSTTDELQQGRPTLMDLINLDGHLYPIGRLDKQSQGLMILTNDGALTHRLTHPRFEHRKTYRVALEGQLSDFELESWQNGIVLDDKMTAPADITVLKIEENHTWLRITLREGRKRQIRRIAEKLGHPVQVLIRESIGPIVLGDLKSGEWRYLSPEEVDLLYSQAMNQ